MNLEEISFSTKRLILRAIRLADAKAMFKYRSNPQIYKFQNWEPKTIKDAEDYISTKIATVPNVPNTWYQLGVFIKGSDELIGDIGIHFIEFDNLQVEIGYTLSLEYQGKGYATEAVASVVNYLFNNLNKHRIIASIDPKNIKSMALLERVGMRKEAHFKKSIWFKEEWVDDIIYAILKEEWDIRGGLNQWK